MDGADGIARAVAPQVVVLAAGAPAQAKPCLGGEPVQVGEILQGGGLGQDQGLDSGRDGHGQGDQAQKVQRFGSDNLAGEDAAVLAVHGEGPRLLAGQAKSTKPLPPFRTGQGVSHEEV